MHLRFYVFDWKSWYADDTQVYCSCPLTAVDACNLHDASFSCLEIGAKLYYIMYNHPVNF